MRFFTAGESHGPELTVLVEGLPAGLPVLAERVQAELHRRQQGHGRGGRQKIEQDEAWITSGVRLGLSTGAPIAMRIQNRDHANWLGAMSPLPRDPEDAAREAQLALRRIDRLRPGHADHAGAEKYGLDDVRDVLERASARETAARVAAGALAKALLAELGIHLVSEVVRIGPVAATTTGPRDPGPAALSAFTAELEASPVRCADPEASARMVAAIDQAKREGTSLGGVVAIHSSPLPIGLGSHVHWERRLDGRLAMAAMSIQSVKAVGLGLGFGVAERLGREAQDPFGEGLSRLSNHAGGLEGGMTNGMPLHLEAAFKPISTQARPVQGACWSDGSVQPAHFERADTCAVPAGGVVLEAMVAWVLAEAVLEKFGGDSLEELQAHVSASNALSQARAARRRAQAEPMPLSPQGPDACAEPATEEPHHGT